MRYYIAKLTLALAVVAGLCFNAAAAERTVPHSEHCKGTLTDLDVPTLFFAGKGTATHFGLYSIEGSNDFDELGNVLDGTFTSIIADGSTISGTYSGTYTPLEDGKIRFDVRVYWTEGTGRLEGVTGEADVIAILDGLAPGSAFEYVTDGTLTFP